MNYTNRHDAPVTTNEIDVSDWALIEDAGAVFLPAAGLRLDGTSINYASAEGAYWSMHAVNTRYANHLYFTSSALGVYSSFNGSGNRNIGKSVRLVCDAE